MTFDAIVGNPPYQIADGGNNASAMPVYQRFVELATTIEPHYASMIMLLVGILVVEDWMIFAQIL